MDPDPWNWTVEDVQNFFRHEAADYIADLPHSRLPPLEPFLNKLTVMDVNGSVLLQVIDSPTLRDDCGISSLNHRNAVLHCVAKLRKQSPTCDTPQDIQPRQTRVSPLSAVDAALPQTRKATSPALEPVGEHIRSGEFQVQDAHGRKRRKLDSSKVETVIQPKASLTTLGNQSYLGDARCTVDELFYGQTPRGNAVGDLEPIGGVLILRAEKDAGLDDRNFQFKNQSKPSGESQFVYSKLLHFFMGEDVIELKRHGREAIAYLPYREKDALQEPSATVLQFLPDTEEPLAAREPFELREGKVHFRTVQDDEITGQEDPGEWDFLMQKYPNDNGSLLPSDFGDDEGAGAPNPDEDEGDDSEMASVSEVDESCLKHEQMDQVIESFIEEYVEKWKDRLPTLENKRAWSVWRLMKRNRLVRDTLIEGAQTKISHFNKRLEDLKKKYHDSIWHNEDALRKACVAMQPTIDDIEEHRWKISVWQRKQEPAHVVNHSAKGSNMKSRPKETAAGAGLNLHIHPDDRFSSPTPVEQAADDNNVPLIHDDGAIDEAANAQEQIRYEDDDEVFATPNGSRQTSPVDPFIVDTPDEMYIDPDPAISVEEVVEGTSETLPIDAAAEGGTTSESASFKHDLISDSDDLPPMSSLVAPGPKKTPRPAVEPIDLTKSSSDSEPPTKHRRSLPWNQTINSPSKLTADPSSATVSDIEAWGWDTLVRNSDRMRILMKALHESGKSVQDSADECLRRLKPPAFVARLQAVAQFCRSNSGTAELPSQDFDTMHDLVPIYVCWAIPCRPDQAEKELEKPSEDLWNSMHPRQQFSHFTSMLGSILAGKKKHFAVPKAKKRQSKLGSSDAPIDLSSEVESGAVKAPVDRKKRKKPVARNAAAQDSRLDALNRQKKFAESQLTDSAKLVAMLHSDPSVSEIEINPAKDDDDDFIYIPHKIAHKMKPHQVDGVRFMWREITAEGGQGCILAHTMGLGKTMQTIALLVALNEAAQSDRDEVRRQLPVAFQKHSILEGRAVRALVLCPPALIKNWTREIDEWAEDRLGPVAAIDSKDTNKISPIAKLKQWKRIGGVLLIGYEHFRSLLARKPRKGEDPDSRAAEVAQLEKLLLETPEIVVADEAHAVKNEKAGVSGQAKRFKTESRIALTGTPMSNDVDEIYSLINWAAPGFLANPSEFRTQFTIPIKEGLYADCTPYQKRKSLMKLKVLHSEIEPKVNRANIEVLRGSLKSKTEFVITLPLTKVQTEMYSRFLKVITKEGRSARASQVAIFGWLSDLTLLTTHPNCLRQKLLNQAAPWKKRLSSEEPDSGSRSPSTATENGTPPPVLGDAAGPAEQFNNDEGVLGDYDEEAAEVAARLSPEDVETILSGLDDSSDPALSAKASVFRDLLNLSIECGDKVLVFSTSIPTLDFFSQLLIEEDVSFGRIDGKVTTAKRMQLLEQFDNNQFDVLLISTKAGGVGLNIHKANRVFIVDFKWNPTNEEQAIGRAYRLGQTKPVFVYRFVTGGTFEKNLYDQQMFKTSLAQRVVDKKTPRRNAERNARDYLYEPKDVKQDEITDEIGKDPQVLDKLLEGHVPDTANGEAGSMIRSINTMETLQKDAEDAPLDAEEQKQVDEEIRWIKKHGWGSYRPDMFGAMPPPPPPPSNGPSADLPPYYRTPATYAYLGSELRTGAVRSPLNQASTQPGAGTPSLLARAAQSPANVPNTQPAGGSAPRADPFLLGGLPSPMLGGQPY